jgi:small ligand-binding sensory domain FIST
VSACSRAAQWGEAVSDCVRQLGSLPVGAALGFVYVTDLYANRLTDILAALREQTGVTDWVGSVGVGICATRCEILDAPGLTVLVTGLERGSYRLLTNLSDDVAIANDPGMDAFAAQYALIHADPRNPLIEAMLPVLAARLTGGFLTGGLSSSRYQTHQVAGDIVHGGLSGVLFDHTVGLATGLTQGAVPFAEAWRITACQDNIILTLNGRPALDVFEETIGEVLARDLRRAAGFIFVALPVEGSDTGDYVVRNVIGVDTQNRLLAINESVRVGASLRFCKRDGVSAVADMQRMLARIKTQLAGPPRGAIYVSCLGRGESLFGPDAAELRLIADALGDIPLAGFFANGEISGTRLYGYTGVLTVFT